MIDVIVVGAGPAGSSIAHRLARGGASVVMLDRARFPRDKPCGGGLTLRGVRLLPTSVEPVVEEVVDRLAVRMRFGECVEHSADGPIVLMTQRRRLDAHLAEQAANAGVDFRDGTRVRTIEFDRHGRPEVALDGQRLRAGVVIGADGANGVSARALGLGTGHAFGVALEGNLDRELVVAPRGRALVELGIVPGGYGWLFPKGDHVNLGVGGWPGEGPRLRLHLAALCRAHGVSADALRDVRGHRLPMRTPGVRIARGRALLVGDAAGVIDPFSGDGMYEAFVSAAVAADCVGELLAGHARDLAPYQARLDGALGGHLATAWVAKAALERAPQLTFAIARTPVAGRVLCARLRSERGVGERRPSRIAGSLERLARAAAGVGRAFAPT